MAMTNFFLNAIFFVFSGTSTLPGSRPDLPACVLRSYPFVRTQYFGDSELAFGFDGVQKTIPLSKLPYGQKAPEVRVQFLAKTYGHAKGKRGLVQVKDGPCILHAHSKYPDYAVSLETMGLAKPVKDEESVRAMAGDIISGLASLHNGGYLHRRYTDYKCHV